MQVLFLTPSVNFGMRIREFRAKFFRFARINRCRYRCRDWLHCRRFFVRVGKLGLEVLVFLGEGIHFGGWTCTIARLASSVRSGFELVVLRFKFVDLRLKFSRLMGQCLHGWIGRGLALEVGAIPTGAGGGVGT